MLRYWILEGEGEERLQNRWSYRWLLGFRRVGRTTDEYDVFFSWDIDAPPADWQRARESYFRVNVIRGLCLVTMFICYVVALGLSIL
jgi:hypothetical protein